MTGVVFPSDLPAWHAWHSGRHRLRSLSSTLRRGEGSPAPPRLYRNSTSTPQVFVAVSAGTPSARAALLAPLRHLADVSVVVASEVDLADHLPAWALTLDDWRDQLARAGAVMGDGHFLHFGNAVWKAAVDSRLPYFVSQHGALTPFVPPLPEGATLLAWSQADGDFWRSSRSDLGIRVVGSQLLWEAGNHERPGPDADQSAGVTYLGQMHGAELSRSRLVTAAGAFCRKNRAVYRPHPSEKDRLSLLAHATYRRMGVLVDNTVPLVELAGPVVSVFSTGVLEAAAQGRDAWVHLPRPPAWLQAFWERYDMRTFGDLPTPPPPRPAEEPARRIARILTEAVA